MAFYTVTEFAKKAGISASLFRAVVYIFLAIVILGTRSPRVLSISVGMNLMVTGLIILLARERKKAAAAQRWLPSLRRKF